ncbi:MAG: amino acid adenylation domain-containing protein [Acidobacteria bacterium]|nr:amino acid adenylation domain-containing protein [Acidobacteriota bacterium]
MSKRVADLSPEAKRELLKKALRRRSQEEGIVAPLSFHQQRLWILDQLDPGNPSYNIGRVMRITGPLSLESVRRALDEIARRQESLRTVFRFQQGEAAQVILPAMSLGLNVVDLDDLSPDEQDAEVRRRVREEARTRFDLSAGPLIKVTLLRLAHDEHVAIAYMHHIVSDGWSVGVFMRELGVLYDAFSRNQPSPLPALAIQYRDYAQWQRSRLQGEALEKLVAYWKKKLQGAPSTLRLPAERTRSTIATYEGAKKSCSLSPSLTESLRRLSHQEGATLYMTLLAAFNVLVHRNTGQEDMVIASPIADRERPETQELIGFLVNNLVVRTDLAGNPRFRELLTRVREVVLEAYVHQELPFDRLVQALEPERIHGLEPLLDIMFALHNTPMPSLGNEGTTISVLDVDCGVSPLKLAVECYDSRAGLQISFNYKKDVFDRDAIERFAQQFHTLLESIASEPERRIADLDLLTETDRAELRSASNAVPATYPKEFCLHQLFENQADRTPERVAATFENESLTYQDLNRRANQLAHYLRRRGVGPESLVGICTDRSMEMLVAILGTLKAGAAYLPLDPTYPRERLAFMLEDAEALVVLTEQELTLRLPGDGIQQICLDTDREKIAQEDRKNPANRVTPDSLAYVIYTSGSTGDPKGVSVTHYNVVRLFQATEPWFHFDERDVWTLFHSYAFDFSVWEIWGALTYGGRLVVVPYVVSRSPEAFYSLLCNERVTVLNQTPSAFRQLMLAEETPGTARELALRLIIFGGEALDFQSLKPWFARHGDRRPRLVNGYGITETCIFVTFYELSMADLVEARGSLIGRPIPDLQVYVLDKYQQPAPIWVPGEIYVGGAGLARGYLARPELTAERFAPNPFDNEPGARLYKSGDLARYLPSGNLEYLGRIDDQIKLRGFRVELGEIETRLRQHPRVEDVAVVAREEVDGDRRLVAYFVSNGESEVKSGELRRFLQEHVPDYMVPAQFVSLPSLPLNSSGKIDRKSLPSPDRQRRESDDAYVAPRNPVETKLAGVWSEVLKVDTVGIHDNFFALGGHSLLAVQLMYRVKEAFRVEVPIRMIFESPTVAQLAERLDHLSTSEGLEVGPVVHETSPLVPIQVSNGSVDLFCLHPVGGQIHWYKHLAELLGRRYSLYGLQSRALADPAKEHHTLMAMADDYAGIIREKLPDGPYHLLGYSSGGTFAMTIASALEARGCKVGFLGLIDAYLKTEGEITVEHQSLQNLILTLRGNLDGQFPGLDQFWNNLMDQSATLHGELLPLSNDQRLDRICDWLAALNPTFGQFRDVLKQQLSLYNIHHKLIKGFEPSKIGAPLYVCWAGEMMPGTNPPARVDWSKFTSGEVQVDIIDADHFTMMRPPAVERLAERLAQQIDYVRGAGVLAHN